MKRRPIAFLFLGETLLIPHLWPIVEALSVEAPELEIDCWVSTSVHEALLGRWAAAFANVRIRRAPGFREVAGAASGRNPELPPKLLMLARLVPHLIRARAVVCAEQTSLWIPTLLPFLRRKFIKTSHGAGSMSARDDRRRRAARLMLVPSELERETYLRRGFAPDRVRATGYVKTSFRHRTPSQALFADRKPIILYAPHWQQHRSSWWLWGAEIVAQLAAQDRFNVILAPHQRLVETAPELIPMLADVAGLPHVHVDTESFAMVDGSYVAAANIYLGDTSSQVVEYLAIPRPCVFLNAQQLDWRATDDHDFWACGDVVETLDALLLTLGDAIERQIVYRQRQEEFAAAALGDASGAAPLRCALEILALST